MLVDPIAECIRTNRLELSVSQLETSVAWMEDRRLPDVAGEGGAAAVFLGLADAELSGAGGDLPDAAA